MRKAIRTKYSLIRYYYQSLMQMSLQGGTPVYRPVFFDYPNDAAALLDIENNVLLGKSLKVSVLAT
jgi:alpha-glucosidase (family GH31 glycosyl hydrolase)